MPRFNRPAAAIFLAWAVAFAALPFVVGGCAGLSWITEGPRVERELARIAVHQATFAFVRNDPDKAARVVSVADEIIAAAEDPVVTIDSLKAMIPWDELNPQQRLDAEALVDLVVAELLDRVPVGEQQLPVEELKVVVGWVREAAVTFLPPSP